MNEEQTRESRQNQVIAHSSKEIEAPIKSAATTYILAFFLGSLGVDRFYLGRWKTGILKLITLGGLGFWQYIDFILIGFNKLKDARGKVLHGSTEAFEIMRILTWIFVILAIVFFILPFVAIVLTSIF